jgi:hypothetical protein
MIIPQNWQRTLRFTPFPTHESLLPDHSSLHSFELLMTLNKRLIRKIKMKTGNVKDGLTNQPPLETYTETNDI